MSRATLRRARLAAAAVVVALVAGPAPVDAAGATYTVPASIDASGGADVTARLNAFIAGVPDGSTVAFRPGARYRIESILLVKDRTDLTFEGNGATFFATTDGSAETCPKAAYVGCSSWPRRRSHWVILRGSGITFRNLTVRGANPKAGADAEGAYQPRLEAQSGFDLQGTRSFLLDRVQIYDVYGDFVYIARDPERLGRNGWSKGITIRDSRMERNGRQGITPHECEDVLITGNRIGDTRRSTFDLEPTTALAGCYRLTIADNVIGKGRLNFLAAGGLGPQLQDIAVLRNRLRGKTLNIMVDAKDDARRRGWRIVGNTSDRVFGSELAAITLKGVDDAVVRENVIPIATTNSRKAVAINDSTGVSVVDNVFPGARYPLVAYGDSSGYREANNLRVSDATTPTVSVAAPRRDDRVRGLVQLTGTAADNHHVTGVVVTAGPRVLGTAEVVAGSWSLPWDTAAASNGSYGVSATAYDVAGNAASSSVPVAVDN